MAEFSPGTEMQKISTLTDELFRSVLYDEEPLFVSDEATLWGVSMGNPEEILERVHNYYGVLVTIADTRQPLWKLLKMLDERRPAATKAVSRLRRWRETP